MRKLLRASVAAACTAAAATPIELDDALLSSVVPDSSSAVTTGAEECRVARTQVDASNRLSVSKEAAEDVVVVQRPVHDAVLLSPAAHAQDALVVVSKSD